MPQTRALGEPTPYEAALRRRLARRAKAKAAAPTASHTSGSAPRASRFAHLNAAIPAAEPQAARMVSPAVARAEKLAADRKDHADLHRFGRVRSEAERQAEDARANRFAREAVALAEGRP